MKYQTIDLVKHVATERGVRRYHKPIGSPIGGGASRAVAKVALKAPAYVVNGRGYDAGGQALKPAAVQRGGGITAFMGESLKPMPQAKVPASIDPGAHFGDVKSWYGNADDTDKDNLSTDLGLDPTFRERSVAELRKAIKDRRTKDEDRKALKAELVKRVALAKAANDEKAKFTNRLTKRLEEAPPDADLAPIIGETLAAHPSLGPLAHIWDRLRLSGYNFKKKVRSGEFTDELPRILARTAATILTTFLLLHFGMSIPGFEQVSAVAGGE